MSQNLDNILSASAEGVYPIRTVSELTGVNAITLRAWERRHGLFAPERTSKGHRLYSKQDILKIKLVLELLDQGISIGRVKHVLKQSEMNSATKNKTETKNFGEISFCRDCGEKVFLGIPENDNRERYICSSCELIHYQNPNIVAGVLPIYQRKTSEDQILLCKRAIEPRYGYWTLPAGFMENGESIEEAAFRESEEEANLRLENSQLYLIMSLPHINQVYMIFKADIVGGEFSPGVESLETELFSENTIPWDEIAFPIMTKTLQCYFEDRKKDHYPLHNLTFTPPKI